MAEFDPAFYRAIHPSPARLSDRDLFRHFMKTGWKAGLDPTPFFSVRRYLSRNPDVAAAGLNPFAHYIQRGRAEGRAASLSLWGRSQGPDIGDEALMLARPHFDAGHYRTQVPQLSDLPVDTLLSHCLMIGSAAGLTPNPTFSAQDYLGAHPDVGEAGLNPFLHFVTHGQFEGRKLGSRTLAHLVKAADLDTVREAFDPAFYRMMNPDLAAEDDEALLVHYMAVGWRERRDPRPDFSTRHYIESYPDIARGDINPFLHFILFGKAEGRRARGDEPVRLITAKGASVIPPHLQSVMLPVAKAGRGTRPPAKITPECLTIHWIIPDFQPGSGGHMTIFRMIRFLEMFGHRCKVWIEAPVFHKSGEAAWDTIVKHFQCIAAPVDFAENGLFEATGDAVVATGWTTAYLARAVTGFHERFYFVQDYEVEFHPTGSERLLAEQTYRFGLPCICASPWLERIMREKYGAWACHFHLAYDLEIYNPAETVAAEAATPLRIAVYARDHTARRCVTLSLMALEHLAALRDDFEVHFFGQTDLPFGMVSFPAVNHGVLSAAKLADLYRSCDIGICFSGTNYSLVPQEMMACGLPVVELDGDSTRAIFPEGVVTLAGPDPVDIAGKIAGLLEDRALRARQAEAGRAWAAAFSWEDSARIVERSLRERLTEIAPRRIAAPARTRRKDILLDVVIPTWNGRDEVAQVIAALRRQNMAEAIQIHCIDSRSTDGTAEWLRAQKDVALIEIDQADFQHGRTRNAAAAAGRAPIIGFLTQDAIPASTTWAHDICAMFDHVPEAAGLFGRHLPYPHHPEWVRREIEGHFDNMLAHPLVLSRDTDPARWGSGDMGWRQLLHFYSDNNSAMRRSVWTEIPYPEVDYGEDQVWARDIIEAGYTKLYAPTACVYHSHDYDPAETFARARVEARFFHVHFGYTLGDGSEEEIASRIAREQADLRAWAYRTQANPAEMAKRLAIVEAKHRGLKAGLDEARGRVAGKAQEIKA
ncbi:rhamnosyltransferase WsaF family glycosyltransferase [Roseicyclus marinus]|uniref:rhamnosyltransferase WsaF family glycosyltransferase n=1 Tax=Roseicyclus marinus TaxID=2161673 RepID=UPI00240F708B|nr:glycosyltransferase [Roseicyclus marinus]MDG3041599.1 glycosyltransferase [Roseicyclus marinus]